MQMGFSIPAWDSVKCSRCHEFKDWNGGKGWVGKGTKGRKGSKWCPDCKRESQREWYAANADALREYSRQRYAANPERARQYYAANRDAILARVKRPEPVPVPGIVPGRKKAAGHWPIEDGRRQCSKCGEWADWNDGKDWNRRHCPACAGEWMREYQREYKRKHRSYLAAQRRLRRYATGVTPPFPSVRGGVVKLRNGLAKRLESVKWDSLGERFCDGCGTLRPWRDGDGWYRNAGRAYCPDKAAHKAAQKAAERAKSQAAYYADLDASRKKGRAEYYRYKARDPEGYRASGRKRRAKRRGRVRGAVCDHGVDCFGDYGEYLRSRPKARCATPGCSKRKNLHADHILPLSRGGLHCRVNCQLLCRSCNFSKGGQDPIEWANRHGRLL